MGVASEPGSYRMTLTKAEPRMVDKNEEEPPFVGGSQPVEHKADPMPSGGRSGAQILIIAIAVLAVIAGFAWIVVPMLGSR